MTSAPGSGLNKSGPLLAILRRLSLLGDRSATLLRGSGPRTGHGRGNASHASGCSSSSRACPSPLHMAHRIGRLAAYHCSMYERRSGEMFRPGLCLANDGEFPNAAL